MSVPFKAGARKHFPKAKIIFDKFHVLNVLNVQLDKVRASFLFFFITLGKPNSTSTQLPTIFVREPTFFTLSN